MKKVQTLHFTINFEFNKLASKTLVSPQPVGVLVSMTGERERGSRGASKSNNISSGVKTRGAKASGVGAVSGAKCEICMTSLGDVPILYGIETVLNGCRSGDLHPYN